MTVHLPIAGNLDSNEAGTRETRLGSVTGYCGRLKDLDQQSGCGGPRDPDRCFTQSTSCSSACALGLSSFITDAVIVHHGPAGCAVTAMSTANSKDQLAAGLNRDNSRSGYVCTDMGESDTVFGATERLGEVIREAYRRYRPSAVLVGASCVSGVIGEDLESIARETSEELGIPVAPIHCEGFTSRIWASGFDAAFHALLQYVVKEPRQRRPVVNVVNFFGGARKEITETFAKLGVEPLFVITNTTVEELSRMSESVATVSTCGTLGSYLGNGLQEKYGVPYVRSLQPQGIEGYEAWLRGLGEVLGKQAEVEEHLAAERAEFLPRIEQAKQKLRGVRALIGMGPGFGFNTARLLAELGLEVVHQAAWHFDHQYDDGRAPASFRHLADGPGGDVSISVSDLQNHELLNLLRRHQPDLYVSRHPGSTVWAMKLGIPAICLVDEYAVFGYRGTLNFASWILDVVTNRSFTDNLSKRVTVPYTDWWFAQPNDHFVVDEPALREEILDA